MIEQNDECLVRHRYFSAESMIQLDAVQEQDEQTPNKTEKATTLNTPGCPPTTANSRYTTTET